MGYDGKYLYIFFRKTVPLIRQKSFCFIARKPENCALRRIINYLYRTPSCRAGDIGKAVLLLKMLAE